MITTALASALGVARASIWAAVAFSAAVNLLVVSAPLYAAPAIDLMSLRAGWAGVVGVCLLGGAALGALALVDQVRGRMMARIATFFEWHLAPQAQGRMAADADLVRLRRIVGGPAAAGLLDLPWIPNLVVVAFFVHPVFGAATAAGAIAVTLLGVAAVLWRDNPHAGPAACFAQLLMQIVTLAVGVVLVFAGEIGIGAAVAAALVVRRSMGPLQANAAVWRELTVALGIVGRPHAPARRDVGRREPAAASVV